MCIPINHRTTSLETNHAKCCRCRGSSHDTHHSGGKPGHHTSNYYPHWNHSTNSGCCRFVQMACFSIYCSMLIAHIGIVSLNLFWTYVEIGVGFLVACLPPCAQLIDRLSFSPVVKKLRSFPSLLSLRRVRGSAQGQGKSLEDFRRPWMPIPKTSAGNLSDHTEVDVINMERL